jgi:hypothetical protein
MENIVYTESFLYRDRICAVTATVMPEIYKHVWSKDECDARYTIKNH